jgi:hypothetical protein
MLSQAGRNGNWIGRKEERRFLPMPQGRGLRAARSNEPASHLPQVCNPRWRRGLDFVHPPLRHRGRAGHVSGRHLRPLRSAHVEATPRVATLARSQDNLRTWTTLTPPPGGPVAAFWLNPATGELLALTFAGIGNSYGLAVSHDAGGHWGALVAPAMADEYVVQAPLPPTSCGASARYTTNRQ